MGGEDCQGGHHPILGGGGGVVAGAVVERIPVLLRRGARCTPGARGTCMCDCVIMVKHEVGSMRCGYIVCINRRLQCVAVQKDSYR